MAPFISKLWTTDPEWIDLLNYVIEKSKNAKSPISILKTAGDFKEKSGSSQTVSCLECRIRKLRPIIHCFEHIDRKEKVQLMFALSASVDAGFLEELKEGALVEVDDKKRITKYEAIDGSLELKGNHSLSAKMKNAAFESKGSKEMENLIKFITEKCDNVDTPLNTGRLAKEFIDKFQSSATSKAVRTRIRKYSQEIQKVEFVFTLSTVKQLFGLSATVDSDCLKRLRESALIETDEKNKITYYKANDGSLELRGDQSQSARTRTQMLESKRSLRWWIIDYFEKKNDFDAVPQNVEEKEMWDFFEFITEKCENVDSPLSIKRLAEDFVEKFQTSIHPQAVPSRIKVYGREIQTVEFLAIHSKVKQLFGLSVKVDFDCLERLRKDAVIEVDENNRITYYRANDGSLELRGDHSQSAKVKTVMLESKRSHQSLIIDYFEKKNDFDAVPENEIEKEMWSFIEFITEKCENVNSPLSILQLTKNFNQHFGIVRSAGYIQKRTKSYCREIQTLEFLDSQTKVKQLFCLSARLDPGFLKELRKDAVVEVDDLNRLTNYTANDGRLILKGEHSSSAKGKMAWIELRKKRNAIEEYVHSDNNSDTYSSDEFDSEFSSDDEDDHLDKPSNETNDFDNEPPVRNRSSTEMPIDDNFDFDPPTVRSHKSKDTKKRDNNVGKRKNSSPTAATRKKKRNEGTTGFSSSERTESFSNNSMRPNEFYDYDTNNSVEDRVKLEPFHGSIQEDLKGIEEDEDIQQIPKPLQAHDEDNQIEEVTIKVEQEEPVEVKPEISHNPKIKFFEAMQSLVICLDSPSLSSIQSKIHQKIQELNKSHEVILNNEIVRIMDLLIARMINHSVVNLSKNVESVNLSYFLCYLKAILNSKISGVDDFVKKISKLTEESQNKGIPMEKVANALRATLDADDF